MTTSAQRDENRLTDADHGMIVTRVRQTLAMWRDASPNPRGWRPRLGSETDALERVGVAAIGCTVADLRNSELVAVRLIVAEACEAFGMPSDDVRWLRECGVD